MRTRDASLCGELAERLRAHVDDLAHGDLELLGLGPAELRDDRGALGRQCSSTRTSNPSRSTRVISASVRRLAGIDQHLDVVRAHERVRRAA